MTKAIEIQTILDHLAKNLKTINLVQSSYA